MNTDQSGNPTPETEKRLDSWKEIAAYLQRNVVTARRWEKEEGLPVHRHTHASRSSVYAYPREIDAWRVSRKAVSEALPASPRPLWRVPTFALAMLLCLVMVGNGIRPQAASAQQKRPPAKRILIADWCAGCPDRESSFSRDGHWTVLTDWDTGDLALREMSSGKVKRLLAKPGTWDEASKEAATFGETPVLSPDSRQIVYRWDLGEQEPDSQLRVMPNEPGGKSRVLIDRRPENIDYYPKAWFPDGKSILVAIQNTGQTWQLARVQLSDGAVKVLKGLEWRIDGSDRPSISPDGQYIAYSALAANPSKLPPAASDQKDRHLYVLTVDGSNETEIVKTSGINENPVWTPDGKHILFTSDRSGKIDLWSLSVQSGKAVGVPSLVSADVGDVLAMGIYGGSYYMYDKEAQGVEYIHVVEIAPGGNAQGGHETESFVGIQPAWSPDGKSIAFKRHHPARADYYDLVVHSIGSGEEQTYPTSLITGGGVPLWFHDGKSIMTGFGDGQASRATYRIGVEARDFKALPQVPLRFFAISQDDKIVYLVGPPQDGKTPNPVVSVDLNTGQERTISVSPVTRPLSTNAMALSPDGRTLALVDARSVARMSVDGTAFRELYVRPDKERGTGRVAWSSDGRSILFDQNQEAGAEILRVPAEGGPASLVFVSRSMQRRSFNLSPDGSHLAFGSSEKSRRLLALDNVLSALK